MMLSDKNEMRCMLFIRKVKLRLLKAPKILEQYFESMPTLKPSLDGMETWNDHSYTATIR